MQSINKAFATTLMAASLACGCLALSACSSTPTSSSVGEVVDDSVITTKIKAKYVEDKAVSVLNIGVETYKGTVQSSGFANSQAEISRTVELAYATGGVKSVKNDIRPNAGG